MCQCGHNILLHHLAEDARTLNDRGGCVMCECKEYREAKVNYEWFFDKCCMFSRDEPNRTIRVLAPTIEEARAILDGLTRKTCGRPDYEYLQVDVETISAPKISTAFGILAVPEENCS